MAYNPSERRDASGKWTTGGGYITAKIAKNLNPEEKLLQDIDTAKSKGFDSLNMHTTAAGELSPEREALHNRIIDKFLSGGSRERGIAYTLGGAPANGKSTLVDSGLLGTPSKAVHIDPDKIKAELPEYQTLTGVKDYQAAAFVHEESSVISKKLLAKAAERKYDILMDGVGDGGIDKIEAKAAGLKRAGLYTRADYVTLDTDLSLKLAKQRALKTGREVPETFVREMNSEISHLVPELQKRNVFDELNLWDTNESGNPRLIFTKKDGIFTIHNKDLYERFLKKAQPK